VIGVFAAPGADLAGITRLRRAVEAQGAVLRLIAPFGGVLTKGRSEHIIERTLLTTRSIEYDAVVVAAGIPDFADIKLSILLAELFRHCKVIGAWGDGQQVLTAAGIDTSAPGVLVGESTAKPFTSTLLAAVGMHRVWERAELVMASS
jgi:catalase